MYTRVFRCGIDGVVVWLLVGCRGLAACWASWSGGLLGVVVWLLVEGLVVRAVSISGLAIVVWRY